MFWCTRAHTGIFLYIMQGKEDGTTKLIIIMIHQVLQVAGIFVYGHLGIQICTFTLFYKNNYPKERNNYAK